MKESARNKAWLAAAFLALCAAGYYTGHVRHMLQGDAVSRVANAFYVLYIRPPHLAAIGLVWNPLPSLLELPILLLQPLYKPLASSALAGTLLSAAFTCASLTVLYRNFRHFGVGAGGARVLCLLYLLNPFIFTYGYNGMSEAVFMFTIIWTVTHFVRWMEEGRPLSLLLVALAMALAFLTRYEALALCAAVFAAFLLVAGSRNKEAGRTGKQRYAYMEGSLVLLFLPVFFAILVWLLANRIIQGDAFYFLHSVYSNEAQSAYILDETVRRAIGDPVAALKFALVKSAPFLPLPAAVLLLRLAGGRLLRRDALVFLLLTFSIPAMHYFMLLGGSSFGWLRFFVYAFPAALAWLPYEWRELGTAGEKRRTRLGPGLQPRRAAALLAAVSLIGGAIATGAIMLDRDYAHEEADYLTSQNTDYAIQIEVADYINEHGLYRSRILLDSFTASTLILNLDSTAGVVTTSALDFAESVKDPVAADIAYIVVPVNSGGVSELDAINRQYPHLYDEGADWAELVQAFSGFRLYRVLK